MTVDWDAVAAAMAAEEKRRRDELEAAFPWARIPEPPDSVPLRILGLEELPSSPRELESAFRRAVVRAHPDLAPDVAIVTRPVDDLVWARDVLRRKLRADDEAGVTARDKSACGFVGTRDDGRPFRPGKVAQAILAELRERGGDAARDFPGAARVRSEWTAEVCGRCFRDIAPGEPVERERWHPRRVSCAECAKLGEGLPPCESCGRPTADRRAGRRFRIFCSHRCEQRFYAARRPRRRPEERICPGCAEPFTPRRSDARYCCPRCRQRAYRGRLAGVTDGVYGAGETNATRHVTDGVYGAGAMDASRHAEVPHDHGASPPDGFRALLREAEG